MQYYTAIVFFPKEKNIKPRKYRNVTNLNSLQRYTAKEGAEYINLYLKKDKTYYGRLNCI